jgi:cyclase
VSAPHDPHDHDHPDIPDPELLEVAEGVHAYVQLDGSWGLNNTGFLVGRDGVTAVDTCFTERRTRQFLDAVGSVTTAPVRTLINTHHHGDHTHGNYLLPLATIIGHDRCREEVLAGGHVATLLFEGVDWGHLEVAPPFVTFERNLTVWSDEREARLDFMGPAHTTNDVTVWLPAERVLFAGDLVFNGGTPFVVMGSVQGTLDAIDRLRAFEASVIVPGHGPVCDAGVLDDQVAYLRFVQEVARAGHAAGLTPLAAAQQADLGRFAAWHDAERLAGNLHRAYAELEPGHVPGAALDLASVFGDMITLNGGRPLRCLA